MPKGSGGVMVKLTILEKGAFVQFKSDDPTIDVSFQTGATDREILDLYDAIAEVKEQLEERELEREKNKGLT